MATNSEPYLVLIFQTSAPPDHKGFDGMEGGTVGGGRGETMTAPRTNLRLQLDLEEVHRGLDERDGYRSQGPGGVVLRHGQLLTAADNLNETRGNTKTRQKNTFEIGKPPTHGGEHTCILCQASQSEKIP